MASEKLSKNRSENIEPQPLRKCEYRPACRRKATGTAPHELGGEDMPICDECRAQLTQRTAAAIVAAGE